MAEAGGCVTGLPTRTAALLESVGNSFGEAGLLVDSLGVFEATDVFARESETAIDFGFLAPVTGHGVKNSSSSYLPEILIFAHSSSSS